MNVRNVLDSVSTHYPAHDTLCSGFWSYEPSAGAPLPGPSPRCFMCNPTYFPTTADWNAFGQYHQPYKGTNTLVLLYIYQYAQPNPCLNCRTQTNQPEWPNWGGGQPVDLDSTSTTGAENYALVIA